jgi:ABC-type microcin C transport system permease subunit YejB
MLPYLLKRLLYMIPTMIAISIVVFIVINLPPGDFVDRLIADAKGSGEAISAHHSVGSCLLIRLFGNGWRSPLSFRWSV